MGPSMGRQLPSQRYRGKKMLRIIDKSFRYVPSFSTDLAKRFKEIIEQQRLLAARTGLAMPRPTRVAA